MVDLINRWWVKQVGGVRNRSVSNWVIRIKQVCKRLCKRFLIKDIRILGITLCLVFSLYLDFTLYRSSHSVFEACCSCWARYPSVYVVGGNWSLPPDRSDRHLSVLINISSIIPSSLPDCHIWRVNGVSHRRFNSKSVWNALRPVKPIVNWFSFAWNSISTYPKTLKWLQNRAKF